MKNRLVRASRDIKSVTGQYIHKGDLLRVQNDDGHRGVRVVSPATGVAMSGVPRSWLVRA